MFNSDQCTDDNHVLARLMAAVHAMSARATKGQQLVAAGEVWDALESIQGGESVEINTELTLGVRRGDGESEEGLFLSIRVNEDEIVLDRMMTTYSRQVGSDHYSETIARLIPDRPFDSASAEDWLEMAVELLIDPESTLTVSRDHL